MEVTKESLDGKTSLSIQNPEIKSEFSDGKEAATRQEVPKINLLPEQIEEIHADEYSLVLFYATRMEPLTVAEIKKRFPEPESKKAQSVLDRLVRVGLVHITQDGKYYSNYPENYINYADYRYDSDLEAKKDNKVFSLMKEFTGNKEYWKNRSYFSMDAFYTEDQTKELQGLFYEIKLKAKEYANANAKKKSILGLTFRRIKFYDMVFSLLFCFLFALGFSNPAQAGGNDPTIISVLNIKNANYQHWLNREVLLSINRYYDGGGGNDPTGQIAIMTIPDQRFLRDGIPLPTNTRMLKYLPEMGGGNFNIDPIPPIIGDDGGKFDGGGGHDPTCVKPILFDGGGGHDPDKPKGDNYICCVVFDSGEQVPMYSAPLCHAQELLIDLSICEHERGENCAAIEKELIETLSQKRNSAEQ